MRALAPVLALAVAFVVSGGPATDAAAAMGDEGLSADLSRPPEHHTVADAVRGKDGVKRMAILRGLDKLTGQPAVIDAPVGVPVHYATLTITSKYCYSTPSSETPEAIAFLEIVDHRPDKPAQKVFSGWMWASSPSLNAMEHPLYDVWVISCKTNEPGQASPPVASMAPVKPVSPNKGATDDAVELPEGAGQ